MLCAATLAGGLMLMPVPAALAAPSTYVWRGAADSPDWQEGANWEGGFAPHSSSGVVNLEFPLEACPAKCPTLIDDIPSLSAGIVTLQSEFAHSPEARPPSLEHGSYSLEGIEALELADGLTIEPIPTGSGEGVASAPITLGLPIELEGANVWQLGGATVLDAGRILGRRPLEVKLQGGSLSLEEGFQHEAEVVTVDGPGELSLGERAGDLNGTGKEEVRIDGAGLMGAGRTGPLRYRDGYLTVGFPGLGGALEVGGRLTLEQGAALGFELAPPGGGALSTIHAASSVALGGASLHIAEGCPAAGAVFTLVQAGGPVSEEFSTPAGTPIAGGQQIEPSSSDCPGGVRPLPLRIEYGAQEVTATAVGPETEHPASTQSPAGTTQQPGSQQPGGAGTVPRTNATAKRRLPALQLDGFSHDIRLLLRDGGERVRVTARRAGTAELDWYASLKPRRGKPRLVLLAAGSVRFPAPGTRELHLVLTRAGRLLLRREQRLAVLARARLTGTSFTLSSRFVVAR